jgi:hypothetical protein
MKPFEVSYRDPIAPSARRKLNDPFDQSPAPPPKEGETEPPRDHTTPARPAPGRQVEGTDPPTHKEVANDRGIIIRIG